MSEHIHNHMMEIGGKKLSCVPPHYRLCQLVDADPNFRTLIGIRPRGVCRYRGNPRGRTKTKPCGSCKGGMEQEVPLYACTKKVLCSISQKVANVECCATCPEYVSVDNYNRSVIRHLAYHIAPFSGNGTWQRNIQQLRKRMDLFNGRRVVAIVTGPQLDSPDLVKQELGGDVAEYIVMPNRPTLREVITFLPLLERVQSIEPNEVTFYAHAKGVTRPVNEGVTVHPWTDLMYETCLDYWPLVEDILRDYAAAGSFKKVGNGFSGSRSSWHYSGTFFWIRNSILFQKQAWREVDQQWWGNESWLGLHLRPEEAGCIFHQGVVPTLDLYSMDYLKQVQKEYEVWKEHHEINRMSFDAVKS